MYFKHYLVLLFSLVYINAFGAIQVISEEKSWTELAPSPLALEEGAVYILISLNDYVDFAIEPFETGHPDLKKDLVRQSCLKYGEAFEFSGPCFKFLRDEYPGVFSKVISEFVLFYDLETPSYKAEMHSSEYPNLVVSDVLLRLKTQVNPQAPTLDPVSLLSPEVFSALWTVPTNQANCFGTAFAAITPQASLQYRDYLWENKTPTGYELHQITDDLVFGDMIEFEIPGDGHATIYIGTDQEGDELVLTKNGFMPSVIQVMKYKDVFKLYDSYGITQVNIWRFNQNLQNNYSSLFPQGLPRDPTISFRTRPPGISVDDFLTKDMGKKFNKWLNQKNN